MTRVVAVPKSTAAEVNIAAVADLVKMTVELHQE